MVYFIQIEWGPALVNQILPRCYGWIRRPTFLFNLYMKYAIVLDSRAKPLLDMKAWWFMMSLCNKPTEQRAGTYPTRRSLIFFPTPLLGDLYLSFMPFGVISSRALEPRSCHFRILDINVRKWTEADRGASPEGCGHFRAATWPTCTHALHVDVK